MKSDQKREILEKLNKERIVPENSYSELESQIKEELDQETKKVSIEIDMVYRLMRS